MVKRAMAEAVILKLLVVAIPARSSFRRTRYRRNSGSAYVIQSSLRG